MTRTETDRKHYQSFYQRNKERLREEKRIAMRKARAENPERMAEIDRKAKARQREKLFEMYGHECAICGFTDKRALTLDHKLNNGAEERKLLGERGVYRRAKSRHLPGEYQILCMNCQFIKRHIDGKSNQHGKKEFVQQHGKSSMDKQEAA